jgi:Zn-dependent peptidase ImmA (M78 family)
MREPRTVTEGREKALAVRYSNNLSTAPIRDLFTFIERVFPDTLVARVPMPDGPEGALVRAGHDWLIIVNTADNVLARQRFTAGHELAHRLFDSDRADLHLDQTLFTGGPAETRANAFAVNLLLPADVLHERRQANGFDPANDNDVVALALEYGVSLMSLSFHLKNNGLVGERRRQEITEIRGLRLAARLGLGDRVEEEQTARNVTRWPSRYVRLAASALDRGQLSTADLANFLPDDPVLGQLTRETD